MDMFVPKLPLDAVKFYQWPCAELRAMTDLITVGAANLGVPECEHCTTSLEWHAVVYEGVDVPVLLCNGDWLGFPADGEIFRVTDSDFTRDFRPLSDSEYRGLAKLAELRHPEPDLVTVDSVADVVELGASGDAGVYGHIPAGLTD